MFGENKAPQKPNTYRHKPKNGESIEPQDLHRLSGTEINQNIVHGASESTQTLQRVQGATPFFKKPL